MPVTRKFLANFLQVPRQRYHITAKDYGVPSQSTSQQATLKREVLPILEGDGRPILLAVLTVPAQENVWPKRNAHQKGQNWLKPPLAKPLPSVAQAERYQTGAPCASLRPAKSKRIGATMFI